MKKLLAVAVVAGITARADYLPLASVRPEIVAEDGARVMPWYFLCKEGARTDGYGVMVQPNAFACWRTDGRRLTLTLDIRAGGTPVELKGRTLKAVTIVSRREPSAGKRRTA